MKKKWTWTWSLKVQSCLSKDVFFAIPGLPVVLQLVHSWIAISNVCFKRGSTPFACWHIRIMCGKQNCMKRWSLPAHYLKYRLSFNFDLSSEAKDAWNDLTDEKKPENDFFWEATTIREVRMMPSKSRLEIGIVIWTDARFPTLGGIKGTSVLLRRPGLYVAALPIRRSPSPWTMWNGISKRVPLISTSCNFHREKNNFLHRCNSCHSHGIMVRNEEDGAQAEYSMQCKEPDSIPPAFRPRSVSFKGLGSLDIEDMSEKPPCPGVKLFCTRSPFAKKLIPFALLLLWAKSLYLPSLRSFSVKHLRGLRSRNYSHVIFLPTIEAELLLGRFFGLIVGSLDFFPVLLRWWNGNWNRTFDLRILETGKHFSLNHRDNFAPSK